MAGGFQLKLKKNFTYGQLHKKHEIDSRKNKNMSFYLILKKFKKN